MAFNGYAATEAKKNLAAISYEPQSVGDYDVEVAISHCGVCHSDLHLIDNDWGFSQYPFIPGHEIIGSVKKAGKLVKHLNVGSRVGIGWQRSACLQCAECLSGRENLCAQQQGTCVGNHGGFANGIVCDSRFAFPIPETLDSQNAAPLLCGGITVFTPFEHFEVTPQMRVGVVGIGGLGHLAVQYAKAFGTEVFAFSSSDSKKADAMKLGAQHFVNSTDSTQMKKVANSLDFIISTVNADLNWIDFINALRPDGRLCFVGVPPGNLNIPIVSLLGGRKSISASPIGGRATMNRMLAFSARHNIQAQTELVPLSEVNGALEKVKSNKARFRMVLKV